VNSVMYVPKSVLESAELSSHAKVVYGALTGLCEGEEKTTLAPLPELAEATGLPTAGVQRAYVELVRAGLIRRARDRDYLGAPWRTWLVEKKRRGK
jgi:DNA-binding MarR family transcriptional regulator